MRKPHWIERFHLFDGFEYVCSCCRDLMKDERLIVRAEYTLPEFSIPSVFPAVPFYYA